MITRTLAIGPYVDHISGMEDEEESVRRSLAVLQSEEKILEHEIDQEVESVRKSLDISIRSNPSL